MSGADVALVGAAYLLGSVPFSFLIVKAVKGTDVRRVGSGNLGATNVLRAAGPGLATAVLLLDIGKGMLPVLAGLRFGLAPAVLGMAACAAVAGHVFSIYLGFDGGKGVATAVGAFAALSPAATFIGILVFGLLVAWKRYVSLGSVALVATVPVMIPALGALGWTAAPPPALTVAAMAIAALVISRHRGNLRRLWSGRERRLGSSTASRS